MTSLWNIHIFLDIPSSYDRPAACFPGVDHSEWTGEPPESREETGRVPVAHACSRESHFPAGRTVSLFCDLTPEWRR